MNTDEEIELLIIKVETLIRLRAEREELDIINRVQDPEQQGYMAGPLMCRVAQLTPAQLLEASMDKPSIDGDNAKRDAGIRRWCKEQLRHGLRVV